MAAGRTLTVNLVANTKSFGRGMMSAVKNAEGFQGKVGALAGSLRKVLGPALIAAAGAAAAFAVKLGVDGVKAAIADQKTVDVLAATLRNLGQAHQQAGVEDFIAQLESATGIADESLRPALGRLLIATGDVTEAQDYLRKALDVSVGTGREFTGVVDAMSKAIQTRTAGQLSRYGVIMDDNTLKTQGFTAALNGALDQFRGLQNAEAASLEGQLRILQVEADNLKEAFGRGLLGALGDTAGGVGNVNDALREMQPLFEELGRQIGEAVVAAGQIAKAFADAGEALGVEYNEQAAEAATYTLGLTGMLKSLAGVLGLFTSQTGGATQATADLVASTGDYRDAAARAQRTGVDFTQGIEDLGDEADQTAEKISALAGWISRTQTIMAYEAAWDDLRETVKENGRNFDITTEKGRENTAALIDAAQRTAEYAASQETMASKIGVANSGLANLKTFLDNTKVSPETRQQLLEPFQALINDLRDAGIDVSGLQLQLDGLSGKVVDITIRLNEVWGSRAAGGDGYNWRNNMARGGMVRGRGGAMSDMIPTMLSNGEFVVRAQAVNSFGPDFFDALNRGINPLAGVEAPRISDRATGPSRTMVIENINVTAAADEPAEVTVPRALRRMAWVSGLSG